VTETREALIPYNDLTHVVLECRQCSSQITVDIKKLLGEKDLEHRIINCPICPNTRLDSQYGPVLAELVEWYGRLTTYKLALSFRINRD